MEKVGYLTVLYQASAGGRSSWISFCMGGWGMGIKGRYGANMMGFNLNFES